MVKFTIGTLSESDGVKINKAFENLKTSNNKIVRLVKEQASVIALNSATAHAALSHTAKLTEAATEIAKRVDLLNVTATAATKVAEVKDQINPFLRQCQGLLSIYSVDINAFLTAWDIMLQKRLSTLFLSPTQLLHVLERIPLKDNRRFPLPLTIENMHSYYNLLEVQPMRHGNDILLYIHVPLVAQASAYTIYRALPWPTLVNSTTSIFSFYEPENELLAVAQDGRSHISLKESQLITPLSG